MIRSPFSSRKRTDAESPPSTRGRPSTAALRKVAAALGVAGLAWFVSRRVRSGDGRLSTDEVRERATEAMPAGVAERIGGEESGRSGSDARESPVDIGGASGTDQELGQSDEASHVDETMTDDEMGERVESDAHEEPAPPGEMNVDDDVAEEVFDDDGGESEDDQLGQDETDMEGDEDETL